MPILPTLILDLLLAEPTRAVRMWADDGSELHAVPISATRYVVPAHRPLRYIGVQTESETCGAVRLRVKTPRGWRHAVIECGRGMRYVDLWLKGVN